LTKDSKLETYLTEGIEGLIRDMTKATARNPKASLFMLKYAVSAKKAMDKREASEKAGVHIPAFLIASVTSKCNLHCQGCYARARENSGCVDHEEESQLSDLEWLGIFEEAKTLGIGFVLIAGGEPFMRQSLIEGMGKQSDILFPIFTNGTLLDVAALKMLDKFRNLIPILSIEGLSESTDIRRGQGIYQQMQQTMDRLNRKRIFYGASITVHKENLKEAFSQELLGDLSDRGCKAVFFVEYVPVDTDAEPLELDETDRAYQNIQMDAIRKRYPEMLFIAFPGDEKESGGCLAAGRGFFHINYDGSAEPCPFSPYSDANIREMTLMEAMESPFFKKLRSGDMLLADHTGGCVLFTQEDSVKELLHGETPPHRTL